MKRILTYILFHLTTLSCNSTRNVSTYNLNRASGAIPYINIPADTVSYFCEPTFKQKLFLALDTIKKTEDKSYSIGKLGKCNPENIIGFKIGKWTEYYELGKIKSQGNYAFGIIRNCCAGGYCYGQYSYKTGRWVYYFENGKIKADITFDITLLPGKSFGCGDTVYYKSNSISKTSRFFDRDSNLIMADSTLLNSYLDENQGWVLK